MKRRKLSLTELSVFSFVTQDKQDDKKIRGGVKPGWSQLNDQSCGGCTENIT